MSRGTLLCTLVLVLSTTLMLGCNIRASAESQKSVEAEYQLGLQYYTGHGKKFSRQQAFIHFHAAASQGHPLSCLFLGTQYAGGSGTEKDMPEARKWFEQGKPALLEMVKAEDAIGQYLYGVMFYRGIGVEVDYEQALLWYTKAANQDLAMAQNSLGYMYSFGKGLRADPHKGLRFLFKAAEKKYALAQNNAGVIVMRIFNERRDQRFGVDLIERAAIQGYPAAQANMASFYFKGSPYRRDYLVSLKWAKLAAEQEYAGGYYYLGLIYLKAGVPFTDIRKAQECFAKAAESDYRDSAAYLSRFTAKFSELPGETLLEIDPGTLTEERRKELVAALKSHRRGLQREYASLDLRAENAALNGAGPRAVETLFSEMRSIKQEISTIDQLVRAASN